MATAKAEILISDARDALRRMGESSVHAVVTSPPYFGLRLYDGVPDSAWGGDPGCEHEWGDPIPPRHPGQVEQTKWASADGAGRGQTAPRGWLCRRCGAWLGQLGQEPAPEMYVEHLVAVMREVRRVLRPDGTLCSSSATPTGAHGAPRAARRTIRWPSARGRTPGP